MGTVVGDAEIVGGFGSASTTLVVDSLELRKEAERVAPRLQIRIPAAKNDGPSHFSIMNQRHQLAPIRTRAIDSIQTREKSPKSTFSSQVSDCAADLEQTEKQCPEGTETVGKLQAELNDVVVKLTRTEGDLNDQQPMRHRSSREDEDRR
jgi:peptidoglycan hydrolase CwlO-like protein